MPFNQNEYISNFNKNNYKMYQKIYNYNEREHIRWKLKKLV